MNAIVKLILCLGLVKTNFVTLTRCSKHCAVTLWTGKGVVSPFMMSARISQEDCPKFVVEFSP